MQKQTGHHKRESFTSSDSGQKCSQKSNRLNGLVFWPAALILFLVFSACSPLVPAITENPAEGPTAVPAGKTASAPNPIRFPISYDHLSANNLNFEHISLGEGLSQSIVDSIYQDHKGFMWFGTEDGLNRYDGYNFLVFKNDPEDSSTISDNMIQSIYEDPAGYLWFGTVNGGLNRFDPATKGFNHYLPDPDDPESISDASVTAILGDLSGGLWIGTGQGLDRLDPSTGRFTHFRNNPADTNSLSADDITSIMRDSAGAIWIGTGTGGLNRFDPVKAQFTSFRNDPKNPQSLVNNNVQAVLQDPLEENLFWVGTVGGLDRLDLENGVFTHYQNDRSNPKSLSNNIVSALIAEPSGGIWIGTQGGGLNLFNRSTGEFIRFNQDLANPKSLGDTQVPSLFLDRTGVLWVGTSGGGLSKLAWENNRFTLYQNNPNDPNSLNNNTVWEILQDHFQKNVIWIGTSGGGLNKMDRDSGTWTHYLNDPLDENSLSGNEVYAVYQDRQGILWIGTQTAGLNRFDEKTEQFKAYRNDPANADSLSSNTVLRILEDRNGTLWVGTLGGGLDRFNPQTEQFIRYQNNPQDYSSLSSDNVFSIFEDPLEPGKLWIGTLGGGLNLFDPDSGKFTRYQNDPEDPASLSENLIMCIYSDRQGRLWIGTYGGGLDQFDRASKTFTRFREKEGLPNDIVYGILEDDSGFLWLSTNNGLSRFDPNTATFKNYSVKDGLQSNEFNSHAYLKSTEGELFFGGIQGINAFFPEQLRDNPIPPSVVVTDFQIFNQRVEPGEASPLEKPIEETSGIKLSHKDDFFSFEFAALHYVSPQNNLYAYKMEGLDKDWNYIGTRRFATYTNVPPGNYTFRVKAANSDGVWNDEGSAIRITVIPPFWQNWWFRILMSALLIGAVFGGFALRLRVIEGRNKQLELMVKDRTAELQSTLSELRKAKDAAEAANRAKSTFLANISHELRTPLNAILGFSELMIRSQPPQGDQAENLTPDQLENLEVINRSGEHLLGLINDVLEMSKIEAGRIALNEHDFDLHRLLEGLEDMFQHRAQDKGLSLEFELNPGLPRFIHADEGKVRQVLMNLLGNAVKFTEEGGVVLRVFPDTAGGKSTEVGSAGDSREIQQLIFELEDTGPGIPEAELETIFDPFIQSQAGQHAQEGTGLGLSISRQFAQLMSGELTVRSQVGKGSAFTFILPVRALESYQAETAPPTQQVVGLAPNSPSYRLLVVDDKEVNRALLVKMLTPLGFEVREAADGLQACEIWEAWEPHLIWMDMRMPVMDGYEATRRIKSATKGQATVIVALTASALEEDREIILSEGCDDYIRKPFRENDLLEALERHLGVQFIYQEVPEVKGRPASYEAPTGKELAQDELAGRISVVPINLLEALRQATIQGYLDGMIARIDEINAFDEELARGLAKLARAFEHEKILSIIQLASEAK